MSSGHPQASTTISQAWRERWRRLAARPGLLNRRRSQGIYKEKKFWSTYLASHGGEWAADFEKRMDPALPLQDYLAGMIHAPDGHPIRILDVGAGPLTYIGKQSPRWTLEIVAVDPLATAYDRLLAEHAITPLVRTTRAEAERLLDQFPTDSFDLVSARNCIDHAWDPFRAIENMVAVAKPGCGVYMHHHLNEAVRQNFAGMHKWNFADEDGQFILSSRNQRIDVSEALSDRADVTNEVFDETWIVTRIFKRP